MIPSYLAKIENFDGFLGSYDLQKWWKSEIIPGVTSIIDIAWVYGEYHVCAAKMDDGTYSIWQSYNRGYSWREQLNIAERILTLIVPERGLVIAATDGGWWASENSGTNWTKISTDAPGCVTVKQISNDILLAIDGSHVWRSADLGVTWTATKTLSAGHSCIGGCYGFVLLLTNDDERVNFSTDGGATWQKKPERAIQFEPGEVIVDIVTTELLNDLPVMVIQTLLPEGYCRHYWAAVELTYIQFDPLDINLVAKFDAAATPGKSFNSTETVAPGSSDVVKSIVFSGSTSDGRPLMKVSTDGGATWTDVYPDESDVYYDADFTQGSPNPFLDDTYIWMAWQIPPCHNGPIRMSVVENYSEMCQSYDAEISMYTGYATGANYQAESYLEGLSAGSYRAATRVEDGGSTTYTADAIQSERLEKDYTGDAILEKLCFKGYRAHRYLEGYPTGTYQAGAIVVQTTFPTIILPQSLNIQFPWCSESGAPWDSREDT